ncbi:MAG TPA: 3-hydroxyacyl-CoA dehydrogenase NAD-binding domain-containing protein [Steroidobacteraceae bacterium]|nr:3-hydroxyacyl-CoA dehydrogenase NAD-binding domain-containing protein [Steroidobacteraceae bacterium]
MSMNKAGLEIDAGIAVLKFNNPPVNSLGLELRQSIVEAVDRANADPTVKAIILMGTGAGFSGGADIREFGTPKAATQPHLMTVISAVEGSAKPVIAAIGGVCMGGGLELALGCHYRVGSPGAKIALPEVKLGLLPGAGGTQRLPRVIGAEAALNMIVSGATVPAEKLKGTPLFDAFADGDLLEAAGNFARNVIAQKMGPRRVRDLKVSMPNHEAFFQFARNTAKAVAGRYPAPVACVEAVAAAFDRPFDAGIKRERELFATLMLSPESIALRHVFQAERAASHILDVPNDTPTRPIRKVGVIGAGTMGGGISMTLINAGIPVVLLEMSQEALDKGLATMRRNYGGALKKGTLTQAALDERMRLVTPTLDYAQLKDADLVIEAVFESMDVKKTVFEKLDQVVQQGAILASNTSALNLDEIAKFTKRPQDVIGLHFFSPANVMRLLEIVRGAKTAKDVLATAMQLAKKIGKVAVISGVCDGFIGNRMVARYGAAAHDLLMAGALPNQVDKALEDFGMAMGPFRMADLAGLDIGWAARKRRRAEFPDRDFSNVADDLCEAGRFGQKTGAGFYRYEAGSRNAIPDPTVTAIIEKYRKQKGITPRKVGNEEIVERCIYALINEGARIVEDGIAQRSSDIDIVYLNGYGFPPWRGGPMFYADQVGLGEVARALKGISEQPDADKAFWTPAPLLARLAQDGKTFSAHKGSDK